MKKTLLGLLLASASFAAPIQVGQMRLEYIGDFVNGEQLATLAVTNLSQTPWLNMPNLAWTIVQGDGSTTVSQTTVLPGPGQTLYPVSFSQDGTISGTVTFAGLMFDPVANSSTNFFSVAGVRYVATSDGYVRGFLPTINILPGVTVSLWVEAVPAPLPEVPEPGTWVMLGVAGALLVAGRKRCQ